MFGRILTQRITVWYDEDDPKTMLERYVKWPVPLETDNVEVWDGGGAD